MRKLYKKQAENAVPFCYFDENGNLDKSAEVCYNI